MASPSRGSSPDYVILEWRGLKFSYVLARLFAAFWLTVLAGGGCFWILLNPFSVAEEQAAIAILSAVVTAWISYLTRQA